jgi:hypothetical protein
VVLRSIDPVSARWNLEEDEKGRPLPRLALSNWAGSVEGYFLPEEMRDAFQVQGRMRELWDDLLKLATHKLLEELHAAPATVTAQDAV